MKYSVMMKSDIKFYLSYDYHCVKIYKEGFSIYNSVVGYLSIMGPGTIVILSRE